MAKRHKVGRGRRLTGRAKALAALGSIDRHLSEAQDGVATILGIPDADIDVNPARTKYMNDLFDQIEKSRRALHDRTWRRG